MIAEKPSVAKDIVALIAEKPSVAKDIARIIGATQRNDGYLSGNGTGIW